MIKLNQHWSYSVFFTFCEHCCYGIVSEIINLRKLLWPCVLLGCRNGQAPQIGYVPLPSWLSQTKTGLSGVYCGVLLQMCPSTRHIHHNASHSVTVIKRHQLPSLPACFLLLFAKPSVLFLCVFSLYISHHADTAIAWSSRLYACIGNAKYVWEWELTLLLLQLLWLRLPPLERPTSKWLHHWAVFLFDIIK